ncbi:hypothetical protein EBS67_00270 [bacterium]|nr:hypothetical protein [bacterium]NBT60190.1 hypothetical protein [Planctomycetia bacterium]
MNSTSILQEHRKTLIDKGMTATFEVPLTFVKSFVGEYVSPDGEKKKGRIIEGIASTEDKDQQGEIVLQEKMDCSYLLEKGYLNWNHSHAPEDQIGKPLEVIKMEGGPDTPAGRPCTFFRALLLDGIPRADAVWKLALSLQESQSIGTSRSLGFSVEGGVRVREGHLLVETVVRHMAATHEPVNAQSVARCVMAKSQGFKVHDSVLIDTLDNNIPHFIFKSFSHLAKSIDTTGANALTKEYIDHKGSQNTSPEYILSKLYTGCEDGRNHKSNGKFIKGRHGALEHLVFCSGVEPMVAADGLAKILKLFR